MFPVEIYLPLGLFLLSSKQIVNVDCEENASDDERAKRQIGGYQMCLDAFDIYEDKIIRTRDSKDMGARYITERDLPTRQDCYQLCCDTESCDVFVYEEKVPGSCYLFECGPPDNFKCKFTKHRNYTSGVFNSKHLSELETEIKFTRHEHELSHLRDPDKNTNRGDNGSVKSTTTSSPPGDKETMQVVPQEVKHSVEKVGGCSRYQFECHTSHTCIAVYNTCDGVPQCPDASDEAPHLDCPVQGNSGSGTKEGIKSTAVATPVPQVDNYRNKEQGEVGKYQQDSGPSSHQQYQHSSHNTGGSVEKSIEREMVPPPGANTFQSGGEVQTNQRLAYGREGEGLTSSNQQNQWIYNEHVYHPSQGNSQIFGHKVNGGMPVQNERYPPPHNFAESPPGSLGFNGDGNPSDFIRYNGYYGENQQYGRMPPQPQYGPPSWPNMHKNNEIARMTGEEGVMKSDRYSAGGPMPQEFFYDESSYRARQQPVPDGRQQVMTDSRQPPMPDIRPPIDHTSQGTTGQSVQNLPQPGRPLDTQMSDHLTYQSNQAHMELTELAKSSKQVEAKPVNIPQVTKAPPLSTSTAKSGEVEHRHMSHIKFEKLTADAAFSPTELDGHSSSPSGAILSLTFGLLITAITVVLVGCRVRTVRRRLRRGGKSFAHDADFLVNGMYL